MKACAIIPKNAFHYLDHLAPLCFYLDIPILTDGEMTYELAKKYYPQTKTLYEQIDLVELPKKYDLFFVTNKSTSVKLQIVFASVGYTDKRFCHVPHGQSDKGLKNRYLISAESQDIALVYGKRQRDLLEKLGVAKTTGHIITMGNLRRAFYLEHKDFYDQFVQEEILSGFPKKRPILLYAPTWKDLENNSSLEKHMKEVLHLADQHYNVIIKLHPQLENDLPAHTNYLLETAKEHEHLLVLFDFPLIYPLLEIVDIYLGDGSSINYDFLYYRTKLYFIVDGPTPIHSFGKVINSPKEIPLVENNPCRCAIERRQKMCEYSFADAIGPSLLKSKLLKALSLPGGLGRLFEQKK